MHLLGNSEKSYYFERHPKANHTKSLLSGEEIKEITSNETGSMMDTISEVSQKSQKKEDVEKV